MRGSLCLRKEDPSRWAKKPQYYDLTGREWPLVARSEASERNGLAPLTFHG